MRFDTIIKGGTVVTAADTFRADIGILDCRIAALAQDLDDAGEIIDATRLLVMPGGIDSHVHLVGISDNTPIRRGSNPAAPGDRVC